MLLWGEGGDLYTGSKAFAKFFDGPTQSHYPGGVEYCKVPRAQSLGWNTHFGALQHLHFMSEAVKADTTTDRIDDTLGKSLEWIEYAYKVATLKIAFDAKLTSEDLAKLRLPSIVANLCLKDDRYVTVRTLFSRVDFQDERRKKMVPDVALGSIFHVLQDSFSPAHTCRVEEAVNGKQYATLIEVYNYNDQVKEKNGKENHTKLDLYPQWLLDYSRTGVHKYENDPVSVGAWLLDAVDTGKEWPEVRDHLLNTAFKKASSQRLEGVSCIGT
ncbi:hypothetical protein B0D71_12970 [Pseudomonas laurylsulfativorans]|uniref:Uncharacterized protein n=2 Tax=Pseudomonas laurylsulfativorans TaxID=1943631 RepID=A0A2S3VQV9_9PSED|nr:hypothetical protein B0D71_12970 [Pseudomonas laurylsulfativorans]